MVQMFPIKPNPRGIFGGETSRMWLCHEGEVFMNTISALIWDMGGHLLLWHNDMTWPINQEVALNSGQMASINKRNNFLKYFLII